MVFGWAGIFGVRLVVIYVSPLGLHVNVFFLVQSESWNDLALIVDLIDKINPQVTVLPIVPCFLLMFGNCLDWTWL